jgi:prolyl oligopeptidase
MSGYGGFSVNMEPAFSASLYVWLDAGGSYAVPNIRGGGEYGEAWHQAGMLRAKQNAFDDFEAAADYLVKGKYTSPAKLAISGGSNGGLLVGAALTQRPDLYRAVVCAVPLLDMIRYPLFGSGRTWVEEYGDPANEDDYKALRAYSPYQHVRPGVAYPAVLMLSADSDDRVDPMHARKMVAALQADSTGGPVLLRIEKHAGHGGADLVKSAVESKADMYAFLFQQLGLAGGAASK